MWLLRLWFAPGSVVTDLNFDGSGRLTEVRDPLATDAVAAGVRADDATTRTLIGYDAATSRATSVELAAPLVGAARPKHSYSYAAPNGDGSGSVNVSVAGAVEPLGFSRSLMSGAACTRTVTCWAGTAGPGGSRSHHRGNRC